MTLVRYQFRRDTAANWATNNPVLAAGEGGFETDTGVFKIGNGSTAWNSLTAVNTTGGSASWGGITGILSAQTDLQTALDGKAASNHTHPSTDITGLATVATSGAYSDLSGAPTLGNSAALDVGTTAGTVAAGNDSRFSDARTPTGSAGGDLSGTYPNPTIANDSVTYAKMQNVSAESRLIGRGAGSGSGDPQEITIGSGLSMTGTTLSATGGGGGGEAFPIGSVFMAVVSTNPGTLLGYGTWTAFGAGRMPIGFDAGDSDFNTVEGTGGAKTHTLTTAQLPSHSHSVTDPGHTHTADVFATDANGANFDRSAGGGAQGTATTNSATTDITIGNTGDGEAHNNMPPYIVVYMWKRTA